MEYAIRLCYTPLPRAPPRLFHGSIGSSYPRTSRIHLKFNHAIATTHHVSHFSTLHQVSARSFGGANCMLNSNKSSSMPSENEESNGNKTMRGVTGASLALACVVGLFNLSSKLNPKLSTAYASWLSSPTTSTTVSSRGAPNIALPGSNDALESLIRDMINVDHSNQTCPKIDPDRGPDDNTIHDLKVYAVSRSKYGSSKDKDEARKLLEDAYNKYKDEYAGLGLGLAWVELLIIQGNFKEASDRLHHILAIDQGRFSSDDPNKVSELHS
ncbi:hypothetical protein RIF29_26533 [Crotalaria pallida]|uniref:Uncharacterized protein n=1 Tax=Crotalaria pallida TaxID=3830 RepID=A0AAN9HZW9_CROPI